MDAKDILGLPKISLSVPQEKKSRPQKDSQRKHDGISCEVYALIGGVAPLMPSVDVNLLKNRHQPENDKVTWEWLAFTSSARKDNLQLYHWVRVVNGTPPSGDYSFAKSNKSIDVIQYTDEEYEKHLTDPQNRVTMKMSLQRKGNIAQAPGRNVTRVKRAQANKKGQNKKHQQLKSTLGLTRKH